ncbi:hypothetical protein JYU34_002560 [Plutella xylostella]|uniref:Secreted protein n=1 Tax=Plutella xylostella TaxID=51655 RepID=A0ABQ7R2I4_PLUXY|nr:hypothetical protein JYU34_002560 [Plutella xylostella]
MLEVIFSTLIELRLAAVAANIAQAQNTARPSGSCLKVCVVEWRSLRRRAQGGVAAAAAARRGAGGAALGAPPVPVSRRPRGTALHSPLDHSNVIASR